jgi:hypothetical protein
MLNPHTPLHNIVINAGGVDEFNTFIDYKIAMVSQNLSEHGLTHKSV